MKETAISVLIPVYNMQQYLDACLQSVADQTFQDFEIICIDDGSTDNSANILSIWTKKEPRLKVLSQKNQGLSVARNHLLQQAKGEYLVFLDADDLLKPDFLKKLYCAALDKDADIVACFFENVGEDGAAFSAPHFPSAYYKQPSSKPAERFKCAFFNPTAHSKLFRRKFLERNYLSFLPGRKAEDVPFSIQAYLLANKIVYVKEPLYIYRKGRKEALSAQISAMTVDMLRNLWDLHFTLKKRQLWSNGVAQEWIKAVVWYVARFHKLSQREQLHYMDVQQEAWQQAREETASLTGFKKYRWKMLFWLVDYFGWASVYFWSRIFR